MLRRALVLLCLAVAFTVSPARAEPEHVARVDEDDGEVTARLSLLSTFSWHGATERAEGDSTPPRWMGLARPIGPLASIGGSVDVEVGKWVIPLASARYGRSLAAPSLTVGAAGGPVLHVDGGETNLIEFCAMFPVPELPLLPCGWGIRHVRPTFRAMGVATWGLAYAWGPANVRDAQGAGAPTFSTRIDPYLRIELEACRTFAGQRLACFNVQPNLYWFGWMSGISGGVGVRF
jgi:hypothetical protein